MRVSGSRFLQCAKAENRLIKKGLKSTERKIEYWYT